jgi:signal transduction histidine kinase
MAMEGKEAAFLGKVTAGFTHELKNVLAIIKESAGLMEDLLSVTPAGAFPHQERFSRALTRILEQVERGVDLSTRLNRLAHSPDFPLATIDLNDTCRQMVLLCERFARLKGVVLRCTPSDTNPTTMTSPLHFQMCLFWALESLWNQMKNGGEITLLVEPKGEDVKICVVCSGELGSEDAFHEDVTCAENWMVAVNTMEHLGGRMEKGHGSFSFTLALPAETK